MYVILVANTPDLDLATYTPLIRSAAHVVAVDGGGNALYQAGIIPHHVIGDLDSLSAEALVYFSQRGSEIERYPPMKDETDFELALVRMAERGATQIDVLGAVGGRVDHTLSNIHLLLLPELADCRVRLIHDRQTSTVVRDQLEVRGQPEDTVSLIPLGGAVEGITLQGFRYPLHNATLQCERSRGISNVLEAKSGTITVARGTLLVVQHYQTVSRLISSAGAGKTML
jgi:thiamine pyrophosphokinase